MKTMCPPNYHHSGFVATHALGHMMYIRVATEPSESMSCHKAIAVITKRAHCFHDYIYIYITPILLLSDLSTLCVMDHL